MSADKIKILYIVEAMGGGVFTYIVDLSNKLVEMYNVEIYIAYAVRPQTPENYKDYFDKRTHLIGVKNFTRSINPLKDIKVIREIKLIVSAVNPDIVHLHSSKAGAIGRIALNGNRIPLFYTPHGYSFLMQNYGTIKRNMYKFVEKIAAKKNCMTISCSEGEHNETLRLTKNATYVNNGIDYNQLEELIRNVEIKKHPFTVFTLGRICYQKNPELFNKIALSLPQVKFVWIGDGEQRSVLTAKNIEITGWVNREEALKLSINGDVFLLTSLWEGLPISLLEAMYMKKLCVVNNVIGNRDVIINGKNGFVCNDVAEFVRSIDFFPKSEHIRENAYQEIINKYNTQYMAKKYYSIYNNAFLAQR